MNENETQSTARDDLWLDEMLSRPQPAVADDGFSRRVMRGIEGRRGAIAWAGHGAAALIGLVIAFIAVPEMASPGTNASLAGMSAEFAATLIKMTSSGIFLWAAMGVGAAAAAWFTLREEFGF